MQFNLVLVLSTSFTFVVGTNPRNPPQNLKRSVTIPLQKPLDTKCKVKRDIRLSTCVSVAVPIIQIAVGIPRMGLHQEFKVILDTGSHGFLIPKRGLQNYGYPQFSYNPGQSSTSAGFSQAPSLFSEYGGGFKPYTTQGSDILHIGHVSRRVPIELVTSFDGEFPQEGLLGMPSPFVSEAKNVALQMMTGFPIKAVSFYYHGIYGVDNRYASGFTGEVTFGELTPSRYNTEVGFLWLDLLESNHWKVRLSEFSAEISAEGSRLELNLNFPLGDVNTAIFDTGCSDIALPTAIYDNFMAHFKGFKTIPAYPGRVSIPCKDVLSTFVGAFHFELDGHVFVIPFEHIFQPLPPTFQECMLLLIKTTARDVVLGTAFHRGSYISYSYTRRQVGIALGTY